MKQVFILIFICSLLISCGKKSDPEYKSSNVIELNKTSMFL